MGTHRTGSSAGSVHASTPSADPNLNSPRVLSAIALASIAAGAIHIAAAATLGSDSAQNLAFYAVVAAAQIVWGAVALAAESGAVRGSFPGRHRRDRRVGRRAMDRSV